MRRGFSQQLALNITAIGDVCVPKEKRDHMANLLSALQYLYTHKMLSPIPRSEINFKLACIRRASEDVTLWQELAPRSVNGERSARYCARYLVNHSTIGKR